MLNILFTYKLLCAAPRFKMCCYACDCSTDYGKERNNVVLSKYTFLSIIVECINITKCIHSCREECVSEWEFCTSHLLCATLVSNRTSGSFCVLKPISHSFCILKPISVSFCVLLTSTVLQPVFAGVLQFWI